MIRIHNPVAMRGRIERCWLFSYRTDPEELRRVLPPSLAPVMFGEFAFWNIVLCRVQAMRPRVSPRCFGISYWHVAYRIPVRCRDDAAMIEGLYFVRSDCDSGLIAWGGNLTTDFNFRLATLWVEEGETTRIGIESDEAGAEIELESEEQDSLAAGSPFSDLAQADRFLKYRPAALSLRADGRMQVLRVKRDERAWKNRLRRVRQARWDFLKDSPAVLEICQEVEPIDYQWNPAQVLRP